MIGLDNLFSPKRDRTFKLDPAAMLDAIGVNEYSIDWHAGKVLLPPRYFPRVVEYFGIPTHPMQTAVMRHGWTWELLPGGDSSGC